MAVLAENYPEHFMSFDEFIPGLYKILYIELIDFNLHIPANALLFTVLVAIVVAPAPRYNSPLIARAPSGVDG